MRSNFCRLWTILPYVESENGLTTAEIGQRAEMAYADVSKAMVKGRALEMFRLEQEDRGDGSYRYKHYLSKDYPLLKEQLQEKLTGSDDRNDSIIAAD